MGILLLVLFIFCIGCVCSENVATGTRYTFRPGLKDKVESIDWRLRGNLVVEWDTTQSFPSGPKWYGDGKYQPRANVSLDTGDLTIRLEKEDSGEFIGQFQVKGLLETFHRNVKVIDPVSKPEVTCKMHDGNITLQCSVNPPVQATFSWTGPDQFSFVGNSITVRFPPKGSGDNIYYCTAENEVNKNTTEFNVKSCMEGSPESGHGGTIAGVIIGVVLAILLVGIAVFYFKNKANAAHYGPPGETNGSVGNTESGPKPDVETKNYSDSDGANAYANT